MRYILFYVLVVMLFLAPNAVHAEGLYLEAFGGFSAPSSDTPDPDTTTAGAIYNGVPFNANMNSGSTYGIRGGYHLSKNFRFDLSYYDISHEMDWKTNFGIWGISAFKADTKSQALLLSAYYSCDKYSQKLTPYLGLGIGVSRNKLESIKESVNPGDAPYAYPAKGKEKSLAYRFALGLDYEISENLDVGVDYSVMGIGDFASGNSRRTTWDPPVEAIGAYKFDNVLLHIVTLGFRYNF